MELRTVLKLIKYFTLIWRIDEMVKQTMNVAKSIGMGVLAGVTVAALSTKALSSGRRKATHMKKNAGRAIHTMSNIMGDVEKMLK